MSLGIDEPHSFTAQLSPADQIAPLSHTNIALTFPSTDGVRSAARIKWALNVFCEQLPYMTGQIHRGKGGYTTLTWSIGNRVEFEQKLPIHSLPTYEQLRSKMMPLHELEHDFRPTGVVTREYHEYPGDVWQAMLASYTLLEGGLVVCIALHHHLVGGTACATLLHRLASICRGDSNVGDSSANLDAMAPLRRFELVAEALGVTPIQQDLAGLDAHNPPSEESQNLLVDLIGQPVDLSIKVFGIRRSSLDILRDALTSHLGGSRPSSAAVLTGLMWCAFGQARSRRKYAQDAAGDMSFSTLMMPVPADGLLEQGSTMRSRDFIGNLLSAAVVKERVAKLADSSVGDWPAALPAVLTQLASAITTARDCSSIQHRLRQVMSVKDMRILSRGSSMGTDDLLVTNWRALPLSFDFGSGVGKSDFVRPVVSPITQRTTHRSFYSYVVILPESQRWGEDVIEMVSCFEKGDMAEIEQNPLLTRLQRGSAML